MRWKKIKKTDTNPSSQLKCFACKSPAEHENTIIYRGMEINVAVCDSCINKNPEVLMELIAKKDKTHED